MVFKMVPWTFGAVLKQTLEVLQFLKFPIPHPTPLSSWAPPSCPNTVSFGLKKEEWLESAPHNDITSSMCIFLYSLSSVPIIPEELPAVDLIVYASILSFLFIPGVKAAAQLCSWRLTPEQQEDRDAFCIQWAEGLIPLSWKWKCSFSWKFLRSSESSWVENSSTALTPDGSSPGAMSWPGHFLSGGLVLIKAWASRNAPYSPFTSRSSFFSYNPSPLSPPHPAERLRSAHFSFLPLFALFKSVFLRLPYRPLSFV